MSSEDPTTNTPPPQPPKWAEHFLEWFCKEEYLEVLKGDVYELFAHRVTEKGVQRAKLHFVIDVLDLFRPFAWKHVWNNSPNNPMIRHHIHASFRNLWLHRGSSLINLLGLSLGMICAICLFVKVQYEWTFNRDYPDADRIYRLVSEINAYGNRTYSGGNFYPIAEALELDFPDIEAVALIDGTLRGSGINIMNSEGERDQFKVREIAMVNADFFQVFEHEWLIGNPSKALQQPHSAVITEELALRLFGSTNVIGRRLGLENEFDAEITGLISSPSPNSDVGFHVYFSQELAIPKRWGLYSWAGSSGSVQCFVKLTSPEYVPRIEALLPDFLLKHRGETPEESIVMSLQPLLEMHFDPRFHVYDIAPVSRSSVWALGLLGLLLLLTACINFVNYNTAIISKRAKEIGIRKILGSLRRHIVFYFLSETAILALVALLLALAISYLLLPFLQPLLGIELTYMPLYSASFWLLAGMIWAGVTLLAGFYPAQLLARLSPSLAIRRQISKRYGKGLNLRKGLIVFQFSVTQILVICVMVASRQMDYFLETPLGLNKEAVLEMGLPMGNDEPQRLSFRQQLMQIPGVLSVSFSNTGSASTDAWNSPYEYTPTGAESPLFKGKTQVKASDEAFLEVYGISLLLGDNLRVSKENPQLLINQTFLEELGEVEAADVMGSKLTIWDKPYRIVGLVEDFTTQSLKQAFVPVAIIANPSNHLCGLKLDPARIQQCIPAIREVYGSFFPNHLFDYHFLDERIALFYEAERRSTQLFRLAAGIAIVIGCMGLFGLISFLTSRRFKEVGIRKVLGADIGDIIRLFLIEFSWLVGIGFAIAVPVSIYFMNTWLETFANHIQLELDVFLITLGFSSLLVVFTVGYQVYRAATADPLESIRTD
ncbi:MAG: FtsX-like permease family protein [Bacteroidota bacterium]